MALSCISLKNRRIWLLLVFATAIMIVGFCIFPGSLYHTLKAKRILNRTGIKGGLVVHVNCGKGRLTAALHDSESFLVHGISCPDASIAAARKYITRKGLYGKVSVAAWNGGELPYSDHMINLLLIGEGDEVGEGEIRRVLSPLGVAMVRREGQWHMLEKQWPSGMDHWTHHMHGPDGNIVAGDSLVGPPAHIQWLAKPDWGRDHRHGNQTAMVSAGGRLFYVANEIPQESIELLPDRPTLVARNAFSGVLLWKKPLWPRSPTDMMLVPRDPASYEHYEPLFPMELKVVADEDHLYAAFGRHGEVQVLDAAGGDLIQTIDSTRNTEEIIYDEGILLIVAHAGSGEPEGMNFTKGELAYDTYKKKRENLLRAIDIHTGNVLWEYDAGEEGGLKVSPVIRDGYLFTVIGKHLVKIGLYHGKQIWKAELPDHSGYERFNSAIMTWGSTIRDRLIAAGDIILLAVMNSSDDVTLGAFCSHSGKPAWSKKCKSPNYSGSTPVYVVGNKVWVHEQYPEEEIDVPNRPTNQLFPVVSLDIRTGDVLDWHDATKIFDVDHHHRCYGNRATSRFLLTGRRGVEFTDFGSGEIRLHHWVRGKCRFGVLPCNGLLYSLPHACSCYPYSMITGYTALASEEVAGCSDDWSLSGQENLEKGPFYEDRQPVSPGEERGAGLWPTFRYDNLRSSATDEYVDAGGIRRLSWSVSLRTSPGAMTAAGGKLFVTTPVTHQVHALDIEKGKQVWSFTAGSRVDSPPTLYNGLAIFGCSDGYVYCLRADNGGLVWRFRAAPADRWMVDDNLLESVWPVHGSVLIRDNRLYVVAGRSSLLDGGLMLYILEPASGKVLAGNRIYDTYDEVEPRMVGNRGHSYTEGDIGVWNDILKGDDAGMYLKQICLDEDLNRAGRSGDHLISLNGMVEPSWFSRIGVFFGEPSKVSRGHKDHREYDFLDGPRQGTFLAFDEVQTYSVRVHPNLGKFRVSFIPGEEGYRICADDNRTGRNNWNILVPFRVQVMAVSGGKILYLAGPPDVVDPADPWGAAEGRKGGILWAISAEDGSRIAEYKLASPPVFDGLIAADGKLFISSPDGRVICLGGS